MTASAAMTSPYLHQQRPVRDVIEKLIAVREAELLQTPDDPARRRIEEALDWLRGELARLAGGSEIDGGV
jgi:hypothetical protein